MNGSVFINLEEGTRIEYHPNKTYPDWLFRKLVEKKRICYRMTETMELLHRHMVDAAVDAAVATMAAEAMDEVDMFPTKERFSN
jgi:hypothetical protein